MTKDRKDTIAVLSAIAMLAVGCALTVAGFCVPPVGEIHSTVLAVLGETLVYAGSIFGIKLYFDNRLRALDNEVDRKIKAMR